jgi:two-component system OmpR family sensor kinase
VGERQLNAITAFLRRIDSLALRTTLVVLIGIGLVHIASLWTYQHSLTRELSLANETRLADQLIAIKRSVMRVPEQERETLAHDMSGGPIEAHWSRTEHAFAGGPGAGEWEALGRRLRDIAPEIADDGLVIGANRRVVDDPHLALISIRLPDQSWINVSLVAWNPRVSAGHGTLLSTTLMALGAIIVSVLLVGWLTRPLTGFVKASKELYKNKKAFLVPEIGPREVRALAVAFNDMQRRIGRLIDDRTQALAAVSHDLKTPITRLRFRIEDMAELDTRTAIAADLDEMERMLDQTLAYLRGDRTDEEIKPIDIVAVLKTITDDASDRGLAVSLEGIGNARIPGRRLALKRAFGNLIDNAVKYGRQAQVIVEDNPSSIIVSIRDHGPGIAPDDVERALSPFVRLEPSRNQETGGFGLGLTIAQAIIEGHGGSLSFTNHAEGGLIVSIALPKQRSVP